jgi:hypothetical protein
VTYGGRKEALGRHFEFEILGGNRCSGQKLALEFGSTTGHHSMRLPAEYQPFNRLVDGHSACHKVSMLLPDVEGFVACLCMVLFGSFFAGTCDPAGRFHTSSRELSPHRIVIGQGQVQWLTRQGQDRGC